MKTSQETTNIILKAVGQENHPAAELVELYLQRWELEVRKDELNRRTQFDIQKEQELDEG